MAVRLYLVVAADDNQLYSLRQLAANGAWSGWQSLGAPPGNGGLATPALASSLDGRLELFVGGVSGMPPGVHMWHRWQTAQYGGWHDWVQVADPPGVDWDELAAVVRPGQDGRLELFGGQFTPGDAPSGPNYDVWHRWQLTPNGSWSGWLSHGQPSNAAQQLLQLALNQNSRLELISGVDTGTRYEVWHLTQKAPNNGWTPWQMLPIPNFPDPNRPYALRTIGINADGRVEAFGLNTASGSAVQAFQTSPGGPWHEWISRGQPAGRVITDMVLGSNADGRLELFATTNDGINEDDHDIWHVWQTAPNNGWSGWQSLGSPGGGVSGQGGYLTVRASNDGRLELFATGNDGNLWHSWQTAPNNGWSQWTDRGRPVGTTTLGRPVIHAS